MENNICRICGMNINEKNYAVNTEALPMDNTATIFKYCPFCGAHKSNFGNVNEDVYNFKQGQLTEDEIDTLEHAAKLEVFNGDFYTIASERCEFEDYKKMFKALANIEYVHAKVHMRLLGEKKLPEVNKMKYERLVTDKDFITEANDRERHAVKFYDRISNETENEVIKIVMEAFKQIESDHIEMTLF